MILSFSEPRTDNISRHKEQNKRSFSAKIKLENAIASKLAKDRDMQYNKIYSDRRSFKESC